MHLQEPLENSFDEVARIRTHLAGRGGKQTWLLMPAMSALLEAPANRSRQFLQRTVSFHTSTLRPTRRAISEWGSFSEEPAEPSNTRFVVRVELVIVLVDRSKVHEVDLVAKETANTTEALDELSTLLGSVGDEFEVGTKVLVLLGEPFEKKGRLFSALHLETGRFVHELFTVLLLLLVDVNGDDL